MKRNYKLDNFKRFFILIYNLKTKDEKHKCHQTDKKVKRSELFQILVLIGKKSLSKSWEMSKIILHHIHE